MPSSKKLLNTMFQIHKHLLLVPLSPPIYLIWNLFDSKTPVFCFSQGEEVAEVAGEKEKGVIRWLLLICSQA